MSLSYKARRRWSLIILLIGLPLYIMVAVSLVGWISGMESFGGRLPLWAELLIYIVLGFLWMLPLKSVFLGVGKADPDAESKDQ